MYVRFSYFDQILFHFICYSSIFATFSDISFPFFFSFFYIWEEKLRTLTKNWDQDFNWCVDMIFWKLIKLFRITHIICIPKLKLHKLYRFWLWLKNFNSIKMRCVTMSFSNSRKIMHIYHIFSNCINYLLDDCLWWEDKYENVITICLYKIVG